MTVAPDPSYLKIDRAADGARFNDTHLMNRIAGDSEAYLALQIVGRIEIYPEHPQESVCLRSAFRVSEDKTVLPQLFLDSHRFVVAWEKFTF